MAEERVPTLEGFFTDDGGAKVLGSKCATCGTPLLPQSAGLSQSGLHEVPTSKTAPSEGKGTLWSYSVANFPPPPPHTI